MYAQGSGSCFVQHVALLRDDGSIHNEMEGVLVWHMGPPLVAGSRSRPLTGPDALCKPDVAGWLSLNAGEREAITDWLAEVDKENRPTGKFTMWGQYTLSLDPEHEWRRDEQGRPLFRRFSCASFVLKAYETAVGRPLLDLSNPDQLPGVSLEMVEQVYGSLPPAARRRINLEGDPPWRIVLAGYVLHALNRLDAQIRAASYPITDVAAAEFPLTDPPPP
jgi:hypothetical protein